MDSVMWSAEDEAIIATNTDATECKRCAVELGYWKDDYIGYFAKRAERKAPEINRGYYARVKGMEMFIHQFLERCGTKCQIINLGCGFDTLYWRLEDATRAGVNFVELDLPSVTTRKCQIIKRNKVLLEKITSEDGEVAVRAGGELHADSYHLVGCDLRMLADVRRALSAAGVVPAAPTLVLSECVLVYLRPEPARALLRHLATTFPRLALIVYEQCSLGDKFGEVMARNLAARGCSLALEDAWARAGPDEQAQLVRSLGFTGARAWDMEAVWRALPEEDRTRAEGLEMLDERELLQQLHQHYSLLVATRGDLFADMDLNA